MQTTRRPCRRGPATGSVVGEAGVAACAMSRFPAIHPFVLESPRLPRGVLPTERTSLPDPGKPFETIATCSWEVSGSAVAASSDQIHQCGNPI